MRQRRALAAAVALALWLAGGQFSGGRAANAVGCAPAPRSHFQTPQQSPQRRAVDDESPACSDCRQLTINARQISLQAIQDDMLSKLGFARPPNITGRAFPNIPDNLRQQYDRALQSPYASAESDMQADQPVHLRHRGDDEDSPTAERIVAFPR